METQANIENKPFKLNVKRTMWIAFAFFGILLVWGIYNSYCGNFLTFLFARSMFGLTTAEIARPEYAGDYLQVQWIVGIVMALDNVAALLLMPLFGRLSDKTHTKIGKRMPFILIGSTATAIVLPFIPLFFDLSMKENISIVGGIIGVIAFMLLVLMLMMMYRSPAVALMPDLTPKPLRSKANGIINIIGYIGGAVAVVFGMIMPFSSYVSESNANYHNFWFIEIPFLVASLVLIISVLLLFWKVKENKIEEEMREELLRGEAYAETVDEVTEEDTKMSKNNRRNFILILVAEFLWFMSFNSIETFLAQYTMFYLNFSTSFKSTLDLLSGFASIVMMIFGGFIADKIGRKKTIFIGLCVCFLGYLAFCFIPSNVDPNASYTWETTFFNAPIGYMLGFGAIFLIVGGGSALVHICSFPLVVDFSNSKNIGKFTSRYYAASMSAQSITPIAMGAIMSLTARSLVDAGNIAGTVSLWRALPIYACVLMAASAIVFFFVKAPAKPVGKNAKGVAALGADD